MNGAIDEACIMHKLLKNFINSGSFENMITILITTMKPVARRRIQSLTKLTRYTYTVKRDESQTERIPLSLRKCDILKVSVMHI